MKSKLVLFLAIIMGLMTTFLFYNYMKAYDQAAIVNSNMTEVVVAKEQIKKNQKISSSMIMLAQVPSNGVHPQAIRDLSEVEGSYALADVAPKEVLLTHRLGSKSEESIFVSKKIQQGYRAVSVGLNYVQSVSNLIEPEDYVDVIFNETPPQGQNQNMVTSHILLSKARVLAVGRRMLETTAGEEYVEYTSVTLELRPEDSIKLVNASERGSIQLILHTRIIPEKEASTNAQQ